MPKQKIMRSRHLIRLLAIALSLGSAARAEVRLWQINDGERSWKSVEDASTAIDFDVPNAIQIAGFRPRENIASTLSWVDPLQCPHLEQLPAQKIGSSHCRWRSQYFYRRPLQGLWLQPSRQALLPRFGQPLSPEPGCLLSAADGLGRQRQAAVFRLYPRLRTLHQRRPELWHRWAADLRRPYKESGILPRQRFGRRV